MALLFVLATAGCGEAGSAAAAGQRGIVSSTTDTPTATPVPPTDTPQSPTLQPVPPFVTWTPASTLAPNFSARLAVSASPTAPATPTATLVATATATAAPSVTPTVTPTAAATVTASPSPAPPAITDTPAPSPVATRISVPAGRCAASTGGSASGDQNQNHLATEPAYYQEVFSLSANGPGGTSITVGVIDRADGVTHEILNVPGYPPADLYVTANGYVVSTAGGPFIATGIPPRQLSAFITIQNAICDWLVAGYQSMTVRETGPINGTTATHVTQTWAPGRPINVPGYAGTTSGPTTAEVWYSPILDNLIVRTLATIGVAASSGEATLTYRNDISHVTERHTIAVPQATS